MRDFNWVHFGGPAKTTVVDARIAAAVVKPDHPVCRLLATALYLRACTIKIVESITKHQPAYNAPAHRKLAPARLQTLNTFHTTSVKS